MLSNLLRRRNRSRLDSDDDNNNLNNPFNEPTNQRQKSRRPPNTAFRQQRLKAWQPILVPKVVLPFLCIVALICIPIGIGFMYTVYNVQVLKVDYTKCQDLATDSYTEIPGKYISSHFKKSMESKPLWKFTNTTLDDDDFSAVCSVEFEIANEIKPPIYLYYKLTNFYQNHRKYVSSYSWEQLKGEAPSIDDLTSDCRPMKTRDGKPVYPCGLVANSLFNDTISSPVNKDTNDGYTFAQKGIAWSSDLKTYKKSKYNATDVVPPANWAKKYPQGYTEDNFPDLSQDELFMNWMKTAALPSFMKLYGKNTKDTLAKGTYSLDIELNYPVSMFGGTKSVIISTSSVLGGRHFSLGICYLIVGGLSVVFMLAFLVKQIFTRRTTHHTFLDGLSANQEETEQSDARRQML